MRRLSPHHNELETMKSLVKSTLGGGLFSSNKSISVMRRAIRTGNGVICGLVSATQQALVAGGIHTNETK